MKDFQSTPSQSSPKFGLPKEIKFCKHCVISNQRPNSAVEFKHTKKSKKNTIVFDDEGICDACSLRKEKQKINWEEREKGLLDLCNRFRRNDGSYDCVVPGSGGKGGYSNGSGPNGAADDGAGLYGGGGWSSGASGRGKTNAITSSVSGW